MNLPELFVHSGSGFTEMAKCRTDHFLLDLINSVTQAVSTSFYHVTDRSCCNRDVKHSRKNLVGTLDADCTYGI